MHVLKNCLSTSRAFLHLWSTLETVGPTHTGQVDGSYNLLETCAADLYTWWSRTKTLVLFLNWELATGIYTTIVIVK